MAFRILSGLAIGMLVIALVVAGARGGRFLLFGEKTVGTVVELLWKDDWSFPVVRYETRAGRVHRHIGMGSREWDYKIGASVTIRYFDTDPPQAIISSSLQEMWLLALMLALFAFVLGGAALVERHTDRLYRR